MAQAIGDAVAAAWLGRVAGLAGLRSVRAIVDHAERLALAIR